MPSINWVNAPDIKSSLVKIVKNGDFNSVDLKRVYCYRSYGSKARAYARIWGLPYIWQISLNTKPQYILEVLSEKFDKLDAKRKIEVLIHELSHIPNNFSGALLPHTRKGKGSFRKKVDRIISNYFTEKNL